MYVPPITARDLVVTDEVSRLLQYRKMLLSELTQCDNTLQLIRTNQLNDGTIEDAKGPRESKNPIWTARPSPYVEGEGAHPTFRDIDQSVEITYVCSCGMEWTNKVTAEDHFNTNKGHTYIGDRIGKHLKVRDRGTKGEPVVKEARVTSITPRAVDSFSDDI